MQEILHAQYQVQVPLEYVFLGFLRIRVFLLLGFRLCSLNLLQLLLQLLISCPVVKLRAMETLIGGPQSLQQQPASQWAKFDACILVRDKPLHQIEEIAEKTFGTQHIVMKRNLGQKLMEVEKQASQSESSKKQASQSKSSKKRRESNPSPASVETLASEFHALKTQLSAKIEALDGENIDLKARTYHLQSKVEDLQSKVEDLQFKVEDLTVWKRTLHERQLAKTVIETVRPRSLHLHPPHLLLLFTDLVLQYRKERQQATGRVFTTGDWAKLIAELRDDLKSIPANLQQLKDEDLVLLSNWIREAKVYAHPPTGTSTGFINNVVQMAVDAGANPESVSRISQYFRSHSN